MATKSRGLGDTIAKATKKVGVKPCGGCKNRQAALNKMFPYQGTILGKLLNGGK